ncbi:hypothetical protein MLD38_003402 [Melastoma candidum]|uniref:Uncharacterized protein n=1 Tax=Melastoma candidum TaxID=119954 RepID=A0ACB9S1Q4_9MYRT|nr:hypothetical protein MLD38_003402 [Melastoma candidum]
MAGRLLSLRSRLLSLRSRLLTLRSRLPIPSSAATLRSPAIPTPPPPTSDLRSLLPFHRHRFISYSSRGAAGPSRRKSVDIGARARQLQNRRLWTYGLTFSCVAGFIVIVLTQFQDQLVFYLTPTDAMEKYSANPSKNKFRLGGLVLEGSVAQRAGSPEMEFVITDLITDILVRYRGSLPDLFREGHSVVVEGFIKPITEEIKEEATSKSVSQKARSGDCYFSATEVLAKHDEKYMPKEVAAAIEKNKKLLEAGEALTAAAATTTTSEAKSS